jgi:hypothetical protein
VTVLRVVERYPMKAKLTASRFGRDVPNDPQLVHDMRRGRTVGSKLKRRILARIGEGGQ